MTSYFRTQGIVLQKQDRGEADRVFTIFTKDFGKLYLRAVSERKITSKLRGGLELFYCSEISFVQGKIHKTITDTQLIESSRELRGDIACMRIMNRLAEIADELLKGEEKDEKIWDLLQETLGALNRSHIHASERSLVAYYFLWNLLHLTGYGPSVGTIAKRDRNTAEVVQLFLEQDTAILQNLSRNSINESLLQEISKEHLLKALGN